MKHFFLNKILLILCLLVGTNVLASEETTTVTIDGYTFYFTLDLDTYTARVRKVTSQKTSYTITIPETVTYGEHNYSITSIGNDYESSIVDSPNKVVKIIIPNSVTSIGDYAFYHCWGTSITLPTNLTYIGNYAFSGTHLQKVTIPSGVTTIGDYAFSECTMLSSISIPNSVVSIGDYAFKGCTDLTSIKIPSFITSIGNSTFYGCSGLTSVTIGKRVTSIGDKAFYLCTSLTSITIPNSVESIGKQAFYGCSSMKSITLGTHLANIGKEALPSNNNQSLSVYCYVQTPPTIDGKLYFNAYTTPQQYYNLYVPYGRLDDYKNAPVWGTSFPSTRYYEAFLSDPNTITIGSTGFATFYSYVALDFTSVSNIKAYTASAFNPSTMTVVFTRVTEVPEETGLYIVGTPGEHVIPEKITDMFYTNLLKGVNSNTQISPTDGSNTNFILANGSHGIGFYTISEAGTLAAGKAYLQLPTANVGGVKALNIVLDDDEATDISLIPTHSKGEEIVYNLAGQRVDKAQKGLYIINGKKVFVK
jgi:hypothetical protein